MMSKFSNLKGLMAGTFFSVVSIVNPQGSTAETPVERPYLNNLTKEIMLPSAVNDHNVDTVSFASYRARDYKDVDPNKIVGSTKFAPGTSPEEVRNNAKEGKFQDLPLEGKVQTYSNFHKTVSQKVAKKEAIAIAGVVVGKVVDGKVQINKEVLDKAKEFHKHLVNEIKSPLGAQLSGVYIDAFTLIVLDENADLSYMKEKREDGSVRTVNAEVGNIICQFNDNVAPLNKDGTALPDIREKETTAQLYAMVAMGYGEVGRNILFKDDFKAIREEYGVQTIDIYNYFKEYNRAKSLGVDEDPDMETFFADLKKSKEALPPNVAIGGAAL